MSYIDTIVFDIGRVLFAYDPEGIIDVLLPDTIHKDIHLETLFLSDLWQQLDRGDLSRDQARDILANKVGHDPKKTHEILLLFDRWIHHLDVIVGSKDLFLELKERFPVYILSNFQAKPFDQLLDAHPFLKEADGYVVSGKLNMMKPEPAIYHHLLKTFNLSPEKTLFLDDLPENIEACRSVGMKGIIFENADQARSELRQLGVL